MKERNLAVQDSQNSSQYLSQATFGNEGPHNSNFDDEPVSEEEFSLRDFLTVLRRRKAILIQTFFLVVAVGVAITLATKPTFRSSSRILVEGKTASLSISNSNDPLSSLFLPSAGHQVDTQVQILSSQALLQKVFKEAKVSVPVHVDVNQVASTDVINISASSGSPEAAKTIAQKLPEIYLEQMREDSLREVVTALDFAEKRLKEKNGELEKASAELEQFKDKSKVIDMDAQQSGDVSAAANAREAVQAARAEVASTAAKLSAIEAIRKNTPEMVDTPVTVTNNQQINDLKKNLADLQSERNRRLFLYKPNDDQIKEIDNQIDNMKQRLAEAPQTVTTVSRAPNPAIAQSEANLAQAKTDYATAQKNLESAEAYAAKTQEALSKYSSVERTQLALQQQIEEARNSVVNLSKSVEELSLRKTAATAATEPVKIIASASAAEQISPRVSRNIFVSVILGILLGCAAAMLQNTLDDNISDENEARQMLGTPILGHSPVMHEGHKLISLQEGNSQLLERFRVMRSNVQFSLFNRPSRSVLITSTAPGEGKTSMSSNLAIAMAMDGRNVILVDADLRRPALHKAFSLDSQPGLTNVLIGQMTLEEALRETDIPNLRILTAGALPPNSVELLNSPAMDSLYRELENNSDIVIFDSPPVLATADAQVLSSRVDGVLYVMELGRISKSAVQRSFELLHQAKARIIGIIFNKVDEDGGDRYYTYNYYGEYLSKANPNDSEEDVEKTAFDEDDDSQENL